MTDDVFAMARRMVELHAKIGEWPNDAWYAQHAFRDGAAIAQALLDAGEEIERQAADVARLTAENEKLNVYCKELLDPQFVDEDAPQPDTLTTDT